MSKDVEGEGSESNNNCEKGTHGMNVTTVVSTSEFFSLLNALSSTLSARAARAVVAASTEHAVPKRRVFKC